MVIPSSDEIEYPTKEWILECVPDATKAWGMSAAAHGVMNVGITSPSKELKRKVAHWKGQPVKFHFVDKKPKSEPDFGPPVKIF